jgi:hypothetical protein
MTIRVPVRLLLATTLLLAGGPWAGAQTPERPAVRVRLEPTVRDSLSGVAWNAMTAEFRDIWNREGVDVDWLSDKDKSAPADVTLPVSFHDRELRKHDPKNEEAFGVTLFSGRSQSILVSVPRARLIVAAHHGLADSRDAMTLDIVLGRLLGRIVAHEVGHALLLTLRHSTHGLMSPQLEASDIGPLGDAQFALTLAERNRIATRFSNGEGAPLLADASRAVPGRARTATAAGEATVTPITWTDAPPAPSRQRAPR